MKFLRALLSGIVALVAVSALAPNAFAANQVMCAPPSSSALPGPQRVVNPNTNNVYVLGNRGCGLIALADIGYFTSQGYTQGGNQTSVIYTTGVQASGTGDLVIGSIPASAYIQQIIVNETAGAAVTGGIDIGTAANGQQVVAAGTVGASALIHIFDAALLKRAFSTTVATPLHLAAHTGWNGANLTVTVIYAYF